MAGVSAANTILSGHWSENLFHTLPAGLLNEARATRERREINMNQASPAESQVRRRLGGGRVELQGLGEATHGVSLRGVSQERKEGEGGRRRRRETEELASL